MRVLIVGMLVMLAFLLAGCKYSDVLTEHVEDPYNGELDETQEPNYVETWGAPEDPTRNSTLLSNSERIDEQMEDNPEYGDNQNERETDNTENSDNTSQDDAAVSGTQPSDEVGTSEETTTGGQGTGDSSTEGGESDEVESDETGEGHEDVGGETGNAGTGGSAVVIDDGTYTQLPENVGTVAAAGQYATIVQMLSGRGGLLATDQAWKDKVTASGAFPNEGVEDVAAVWADGSDGSTLDVAALVDLHPDAVLVDNYESCVPESQVQTLVDAGINVVNVPTLGQPGTSDANITTAVNYVGQLLASSGNVTYDTADAAEQYTELHNSTLESCESNNGGPSYKTYGDTAYTYYYQGDGDGVAFTSGGSNNYAIVAIIDEWTHADNPNATAVRNYYEPSLVGDGQALDASDGVGLAVQGSGGFMLADYYLQLSGGVNNSYETTKPTAAGNGVLSYSVIPGNPAGLFSRSILTRERPSPLWFKITDSDAYPVLTVGDGSFPGVLVRSEDIRDKVASSAAKSNGLYHVGQSYKVWVIPSGLAGSWEDGTVESFLLSPWAFGILRPDDSKSWEAYLTQLDSFYSTFYRCGPASVASNYADQKGTSVD